MSCRCRRCCPGSLVRKAGGGNIILTGFMGSGKTTVGKMLARRLGWRFMDLDREIEKGQGMKVRDIFSKMGEARFRDLEHRAIRGLSRISRTVVAAGGGAPAFARNRKWLKRAGCVVYLKVPASVLGGRLAGVKDRPLLFPARGRKSALKRLISGILSRREPFYRRADLVVRVGGSSPAGTVGKVIRATSAHCKRREGSEM